MKNKLHNQRGNVLIYILIAIALLAALSYAVSRGSRSSGSALTGEQARIAAQEIIDYGNDVATAVQKLILRGCSDTEISFENAVIAGYSNTVSTLTDESCHVFSENGGRINWVDVLDNVTSEDYLFTGASTAGINIGTFCGSPSPDCTDLMIMLHGLSENLCGQINTTLGNNFSTTLEQNDGHSLKKFDGDYTRLEGIEDTVGGIKVDLENVEAACVQERSSTEHFFYKVLIAR